MVNKKFSESDQAIQLKNKIENWRKNKTSKEMPEAFWIEAVSQSKIYNPSAIAKFLNIGHADLIKRMPQYKPKKYKVKKTFSHGFVELSSLPEVKIAPAMEVHLMNREGQSAIIRHSGSSTDWENVFAGWFKASHSIQQGQTS
jgi:hypothetical protein